MSGGISNQPKILRGAFVEFGISLPPLFVVFQFNPLTIRRTRTASTNKPASPEGSQSSQCGNFIKQIQKSGGKSLVDFRSGMVTVTPETLQFDIRLDATDKLDEGDAITEQFGIAPQISTLESMMVPKDQSVLGGLVTSLICDSEKVFAFFDDMKNPPVILFIWGRKKIMPVTITNMTIKEDEFNIELNPIRATVSVTLEVIEGSNAPFLYTKTMKEVMSAINLVNIADMANTMVPG